jgi:hypothetical protein
LEIAMIEQPIQWLQACYKILAYLNWLLMFLLGRMDTMRSFLRTGFGELATSYSGTHEECLAGYGQGNAAAGPGFTAMSLLIMKSYIRDGFGAQIYSSYHRQLVLLATVVYFDNTSLYHSYVCWKPPPWWAKHHLKN